MAVDLGQCLALHVADIPKLLSRQGKKRDRGIVLIQQRGNGYGTEPRRDEA
ncbi:hypothetical protein D3C73_1480580 [compost metagenome]